MKIVSEKTGKEYKTVEECLAAESEFDEARRAKEEAKKALAAKRSERAKEVEAAYKEALHANKHYKELLAAFCKDYGSFHMTYHDEDPFEAFWDIFL